MPERWNPPVWMASAAIIGFSVAFGLLAGALLR